jgi:hypothetical protein
MQTNTKLAERLLTRESDYQWDKMATHIEHYEQIRRIMKNNRKVKLHPLERECGRYDLAGVSVTQSIKSDFCNYKLKE